MTRRAWAAVFLALLTVAGAVLLALHWRGNETAAYYQAVVQPVSTAAPVTWPNGPVNVNTADQEALQTLQGINQSQIEALMADRAINGAFDYPEDLIYVKGIGDKTLEKIYDQLDFSWRGY